MRKGLYPAAVVFLLATPLAAQSDPHETVPAWAADAVFYQIFPERFRNGDRNNDPIFDSIEYRSSVSSTWKISPWTADWYSRQPWEVASGDHFFNNGVFHRRYGGDLQGVIDKLDYLSQLGINVIYFNPVFYARSMHKYDGNSFHHIDPYFGPSPEEDFRAMAKETADPKTWRWTAADRLFLKLIQEAHRRDIRIVIDGVFNHTGRDFFAFEDLHKNQQASPYRDWYIVESFDDPKTERDEFKYEGWWGVESLPVFADSPDGSDLHEGPKAYVFDATRRWMDPNGDGDPIDGIDGWRLDVAAEVPLGFWKSWNEHVRRLNPHAYTVAELWGDAASTLVEGKFSATMNYQGFAFLVKGYLIDGKLSAADFADLYQERLETFPQSMRPALQNLIDSHDTERVASMVVNAERRGKTPYRQPEKFDYDVGENASPRYDEDYLIRKPNGRERQIQRLVALFQFTAVGAPMIYYGTEAGMWGADDPCDRKPMVWDDLTHAPETSHPFGKPRPKDTVHYDQDLGDYYRNLIRLRREHASLRTDDFVLLHAADDASTLAFSRPLGDQLLVVAVNRSTDDKTIELDWPTGKRCEKIFSSSSNVAATATVTGKGKVTLQLGGLNAAVFHAR